MSIFGKNQGANRPTAFGTLLSAATYGQTIPKNYGMTQVSWLPIWAANLRMGAGPGQKKFKLFKKGIQNYIENIDGILGHNPTRGVNQIFVNGTPFPTEIVKVTFTGVESPLNLNALDPQVWWYDSEFLPHMLAVLTVTQTVEYSFTIDDYGGQGPLVLSGSYEIPFWNELEQGPDPTNNSAYRNYPYCYRWQPDFETSVYADAAQYGGNLPTTNFNVYYIQLLEATSYAPPISRLGLVFENELGNGPEYADAPSPFDEQQIIYPQYSGLGSSDIDLGASASLPQIQPEVMGKWGIYPTGDCDFVDIIEDTFKSGIAQAAIGASDNTAFTQQETGLSSYDYPGLIQLKWNSNVEPGRYAGIPFNLPNTPGNFLLCMAVTQGLGSPPLIPSSTNGETWTPVFPGTPIYQVWYATAIGGPMNTVTLSGWGYDWVQIIAEVGGLDALDAVAYSVGASTATVASTVQNGLPGYLLAVPFIPSTEHNVNPFGWTLLTPQNQYGFDINPFFIQSKVIRAPGPYSITEPGDVPAAIALFSFKATQAQNYPMPLGNFMDLPSLDLTRKQCRANGLWGSLTMNSQSSASDWLKTLYQAANAAPVFLGSKLYTLPYSEVSVAGNGAFYQAPTASGPIATLSDIDGDFITDAMPELDTASRIDLPNVLQLQIISREANYNQIVISQPESASIALYGVRKADPVVNNAIQDATIARMILGIMVRKNQYGGDTYSFTLKPKWALLSPMDLITITDSLSQGAIVNKPVRLTSMEEQDDGSFECEAEPFIYGMYAPTPYTTTSPTQTIPNTGDTVGNVNPPVIFEAVPGLYPGMSGDELWIVVSSGNPDYGGCLVYISTDGGGSYILAGTLIGSAITGYTTADWPAAADPDSTNNLSLNLSESNGVLQSYSTIDENNFLYPCYVQGGNLSFEVNGIPVATGSPLGFYVNGVQVAAMTSFQVNGVEVAEAASATFDYELMTYALATLTGTNEYELMATGAGNFLRRAVFGAPDSGSGVDHPVGSRFAFLSPSGTGILKLQMPTVYVGQTLYFKILSFNQFGAGQQNLTDEGIVTYSYTPTGIPGMV